MTLTIEEQFALYAKILEPVLREPLELGRKYCSPIPRGDHYETSASFNVYEYKDLLLWKDWGHMNASGNRPHHLVMDIYGVDEKEAKLRLSKMDLPGVAKVHRKSRNTLEMYDRPGLNKKELEWWKTGHVTKKTLEKFNTYGTDRLVIHGEKHGKSYSAEVFNAKTGLVSFSYRGGVDLEEFQWYQPEQHNPYGKKDFLRNGNFIYGWDQLPYKVEVLTVLSGMKDGLAFHEASGEYFLAMSGEGGWRQLKALLPQLKRRCGQIRTLMDPDFPGVAATGKFIEKLDIHPLPFKYVDKKRDVFQLSRDFGKEWLSWRLDEAFNRL